MKVRALPSVPSATQIGGLALIAAVSMALLVFFQAGSGVGGDWYRWFEALPAQLAGGDLYSDGYGWRWSPVAAWAFAGIVLPLGLLVWSGIHVVAVLLLARVSPILMWATLFAWPFWVDLIVGNVFTFVFVAAVFALRGSKNGALIYLALTLLMPRPVQAPLLVWLLWQRPDVRLPFLAMFVVHGLAVLLSGYTLDWAAKLASSSDEVEMAANLAPSRLIGWAWPLLGVPLAIWLTRRGRVGWASLALAPYWLPQYLLMGLLELPGVRRQGQAEPLGIGAAAVSAVALDGGRDVGPRVHK